MNLYKNELINFLGKNMGELILFINKTFTITYMIYLVSFTIQYGNPWKYFSFWFGFGYLAFFYLWLDWLGKSFRNFSK